MFGPKYLQGCAFAFVLLTILGLTLDGLWLGATDYGVLKDLTTWQTEGFSIWQIPRFAGGFIMAIPYLIAWDYSFFQSLGVAGGMMRLILFVSISIGFVWGFFQILYPIIGNLLAGVGRGIAGLIGLIR